MNDNKNTHTASGIGVVTLFVVLLILCLTVFSVLAFASANADMRLSEKNSEMVKAYYAADNAAALISADVTSFWKPGASKPDARAVAELKAGIASYEGADVTYADVRDSDDGRGLVVSYGVFMDAVLTLEVELSLPRGGACEVLSWRVMAEEPDSGEDFLPVWEG
jgi:Na+-transporting methylmalonyl-CoA/oxaloacetate decarboxylase gamma subunit